MKNFLKTAAAAAIFLSSCSTSRMTSYTDDVYANPAEERKLEQIAAAERAKERAQQEAEDQQMMNEERAAQKAKEDNNPYYKDPQFNADDYYDYEYASRLNRFYNPIGVGYYDSYYTNMYTYNQNPAFYGTSIYSSYNYGYGMPSTQFNAVSIGISSGWGYGGYNYGYNPYFYNNPFYYDPWCYNGGYYSSWGCGPYYGYNSWGYSSGYYNGYNQGYYNGWNNARWGYYNMFDVNSGYSREYAPRGSNGGGNSGTRSRAGMDAPEESGRQRYAESVSEQQRNAPRFINSNGGMSGKRAAENPNPGLNNNQGMNNNDRMSRNRREPVNVQPQNTDNGRNDRMDNPARKRQGQSEDNGFNNNNNNSGKRGGWDSSPGLNNNNSNNNSGGGGSSPRNSGSSGNSRPRR